MWERLWRRTVLLAREYPPLWLPVILADLSGFALRSSRRAAALLVARLMLPMFHGHSVLVGSTAPDYGPTLRGPTLAVASLIGFLLESSQIVFYVAALFITAGMVWRRLGSARSNERSFTLKTIATLSIRALLVAVGLGILDSLLLWVAMNTRLHAVAPQWIVSVFISAITLAMFAYVMVPPAVRLLADPVESPPKHSIRLGRQCAIAAVVGSAGLMILEHIAIGAFHGSHAEILGVGAIESLIAALPYVPLYIALALLARNKQTEVPEELAVLVPEET